MIFKYLLLVTVILVTCVAPASANVLPTVNAGSDQAKMEYPHPITLIGVASDSDGSVVSYQWSQLSGTPVVNWTDADTFKTKFLTPRILLDETLVFQLTVVDDAGGTATDTVNIELNDRATSTVTSPVNNHVYRSDEDIIVSAVDIKDSSDEILFVNSFIRSVVNGQKTTVSGSSRNLTLNYYKTEGSVNSGTPASLGLKAGVQYQVIVQVFDGGLNHGGGWFRAKNFTVDDGLLTPKVTIDYIPGTAGYTVNWHETSPQSTSFNSIADTYIIKKNQVNLLWSEENLGWSDELNVGNQTSKTYLSQLPSYYSFTVKACKNGNCTPWSAEASVKVVPPSTLCTLSE